MSDVHEAGVPVQYISTSELSAILTTKSLTVIDVRNDDFEGGHIPGATNIPHGDEWEDPVFLDKIIESVIGQDKVVLHCMKSQARGPYCARSLATRLAAIEAEKKPEM
jgi:rhodanese-related sulfurtransferase